MKTDAVLKQDIQDELEWDPCIDASRIGVAVDDGIVTLTGHTKTFAEKLAAENAARRIYGVRDVVENIIQNYLSGKAG